MTLSALRSLFSPRRTSSAPKFEAFCGRGHADYFGIHGLEDFISVIDGRPSLVQEMGEA
jgi:hypothetical protein